jgi:Tfp pilus assembly protein PilV
VNVAAVIDHPGSGQSKLGAKLRNEEGLGLIELLIALLVLNLGIFATLGAFTSGAVAIRNASRVSTAAALADKNMESLRDNTFANIAAFGPQNQTGADGRTYSVTATVTTGSQLTSGSYQGSTAVKVVTLTVKDPSNNNKLLVTTSSTFSQCAQDLTTSACST